MASTPYWGRLPPPRARRMSESSDPTDRRQSLDNSNSTQPRYDSHRISGQTAVSDAPTESTYTPFASPTSSKALGAGLTPRPPSFSYTQKQRPPDTSLESFPAWQSRDRTTDDYDFATTTSPLPAAPDVPKAPPISYRSAYRNNSSSYNYNSANQLGPLRPSPRLEPWERAGDMEPDSFYKDAAPPAERQWREPASGQYRQNVDHNMVSPEHLERELFRAGSIRRPSNAYWSDGQDPNLPKRREPLVPEPQQQQQQQQQMWAADRSPLQKLELTLDSITKEEKRARVEAAERRARERAARVSESAGGMDYDRLHPDHASSQPPRPRDRDQPAAGGPGRRVVTADPVQAMPSAAAVHNTLPSRDSPRASLSYDRQEQASRPQNSTSKSRGDSISTDSVPRRNLSFRDRAVATERGFQQDRDAGSPNRSAQTAAAGKNSVPVRTSSNKLRKNPPSDWLTYQRAEAEQRSAANSQFSLNNGNDRVGAQPSYYGAGYGPPQTSGGTTRAMPSSIEDLARPPARGKTFGNEDNGEERPSRMREFAAAIGFRRSNSMSMDRRPSLQKEVQSPPDLDGQYTERSSFSGLPDSEFEPVSPVESRRPIPITSNRQPPALAKPFQGAQPNERGTKSVKFEDREYELDMPHDDMSESMHQRHHLREYLHHDGPKPGQVTFQASTYSNAWEQGPVGILSGSLLDLTPDPKPMQKPVRLPMHHPVQLLDTDKPWWENNGKHNGKRRPSVSMQPPKPVLEPPKPVSIDVDDDDTQTHTGFNPPLYLKCGPLLRYCGMQKGTGSTGHDDNLAVDGEIWRGSVMIVTQDAGSSYDTAPVLRMFVQPIELLPPPPVELRGEQPLLPEYVDPIAGIPKIGQHGETLYVRPVDQLEEAKDLSTVEPDDGLFETTRSASDNDPSAPDAHGSFPNRKKRIEVDGERLGKYKDVTGFRLHSERGHTFWRFNIQIELRDTQQRIAYRVNRGPVTGFWVPARGESMNIMFHSCNGFSQSVNPDDFSGPDPMWRDVLNVHQTRPFHVMIGGGDQVYNDMVASKTKIFREWIAIRNPLHKNNAPFTAAMQDELEAFYMERYMLWFSQGLFGLASSQIPMVNMWDDHDIIDGFGSYPHHFMKSPVFSGLGNVAFKYYILFQHQSVPDETEESESSWCLGTTPGPYINQLSRSLFVPLGAKVALLAVDARTERTREEVIHPDTWRKLIDRCYDEINKGTTQHLLVLLGVPIAYPRLVWLENILTSRLMDPVKALSKFGLLGNFLNSFDGGVEVLDDLDDHWTAKNHKEERRMVIEDLQDLSVDKSIRVTILSGDVHLAAVGQFYSKPKLKIPKHKDFRYMLNIVSSAIANTPPPDLLADVLNKRNKIHHFDKETDENMMPLFAHGVDGKPRNNKHLLPHRNWCSIRPYVPGHTPPPTPPPDEFEFIPDVTPPSSRGGLLRRFSLSKDRGPTLRPDVHKSTADRSRPPLSGGFTRAFSRRGSSSDDLGQPKSGGLLRSFSLGSRRRNTLDQNNKKGWSADDGIDRTWEQDDNNSDYYMAPAVNRPTYENGNSLGLRGGAGDEYEVGDEAQFTARPPHRAFTQPAQQPNYFDTSDDGAPTQPFHRTPTGLTVKRLEKHKPEDYEVNAEGGLEVCLNLEVNPKDPAGITVPYRLLVPRLWYEDEGIVLVSQQEPDLGLGPDNGQVTGQGPEEPQRDYDYDDYDDDNEQGPVEIPQKKPSILKRILRPRKKESRQDQPQDRNEYEDEVEDAWYSD